MSRLLLTVALLIVLCLALPAIAHAAQGAVQALVSLLVLFALLRLIWPSRRGRR